MLELLFESVSEMCSKFIVDMMDVASGMFTEILSCDLYMGSLGVNLGRIGGHMNFGFGKTIPLGNGRWECGVYGPEYGVRRYGAGRRRNPYGGYEWFGGLCWDGW